MPVFSQQKIKSDEKQLQVNEPVYGLFQDLQEY